MNNLNIALKNLTRKGQHNLAKILCLAVGLAVASVMITQVYFEQTFDTWFPHADRTYCVTEIYIRNGVYKEWSSTPGGVAKGLEKYCPQVEAATRVTGVFDNTYLLTSDKQKLKETVWIADSSLFDIFPRQIIAGDAKKALQQPAYCVVSRSFAEKIGLDKAVGTRLSLADHPVLNMTIGAVFEDFPHGSTLHGYDIILSMPTMSKWKKDGIIGYDGSNNWLGNDCYASFVRLSPGTHPDDLAPYIQKMMADNIDQKALRETGTELNFGLRLLSKSYSDDPYVKKMCWIMSILAIILLFSTVMNYLLIMIGNVLQRSREMAVRKCFGAGRGNIFGLTLTETALTLVISILMAAILIFCCKGSIQSFLSAPIEILIFNPGAGTILTVICLIILIVGGVVPAMMYNRTPVTAAFRGYHTSRRRWKLALLAIQFASSALLVSLLIVIHLQYTMMVTANTGYDYQNLVVANITGGENDENYTKCEEELARMPEVDQVSSCDVLPFEYQSGNNISLPSDEREFNIADLYNVGKGYTKMLNLDILEGKGFTEDADSLRQIMVSHSFVGRADSLYHWKGSCVGKQILISQHSDKGDLFTICGVYADISIGTLAEPDNRPSVMFYHKRGNGYIIAKLHKMDHAAIDAVRGKLEELFPDRDVDVRTYSSMMAERYTSVDSFRKGIMVAGIATFAIALVGLIGYTVDEVNRRRKEIAIRKVNGASVKDILGIFIRSILWIAIPSLAVGAIGAYIVSDVWLTLFSEKIFLSPAIFIGTIALLLAVVIVIVVFNSYKVANDNPVRYLKDE